MRQEGVPVIGFTWYSLTDQMDWDTALREDAGRVNAVGLFDLNRGPRAVGHEYRELVSTWANLETQEQPLVAELNCEPIAA